MKLNLPISQTVGRIAQIILTILLLPLVANASAELCAQVTQIAFIGNVPARPTIYDALRVSIFPIEKSRRWCQQESRANIDCAYKYYKFAYFISPDRSLEICKNEAAETLSCATESFKFFNVISFERALRFCRDETHAVRACAATASFGDRHFDQVVENCRNDKRN